MTTYFVDCLETSFKYLYDRMTGCQEKTLGKLYTFTRVNMLKIVKKNARKKLEKYLAVSVAVKDTLQCCR